MTIAGLDGSGGAGIVADVRTVASLGFHPAAVITAVTFQNTQRLEGVFDLTGEIERQIETIKSDLKIVGIKTGMIYSMGAAEEVKRGIEDIDAVKVLDPVIEASVGGKLSKIDVYKHMLPSYDVVTPNAHEAAALSEIAVNSVDDAIIAAEKLHQEANVKVIVTGGSLGGVDVIYDGKVHFVEAEMGSITIHGTGCIYSSALTCFLARGESVIDAARKARLYVIEAAKRAKIIGKGLPVANPYISEL
jgi:hydroxymethylpyrimidine/phosphomethylpyrimidine kinase